MGDLKLVGCMPPQPILDPVYKCSSENPVKGQVATGPEATGLCGRVVEPPIEEVIDEIQSMLLLDEWQENYLPNATQIWLDVWPDPCIAQPDNCATRWNAIGSFGLLFALITNICICVPCVLDCFIDRRIREARRLFEMSTTTKRMVV